MTGCSETALPEAVSAVHCAAAGFTSVQLRRNSHTYIYSSIFLFLFFLEKKKITYRYRAEGPTTDARNADASPEPLPTSRQTHGLETSEKWPLFNRFMAQ